MKIYAVLSFLALGALLGSCGGEYPDPRDEYKNLVGAAEKHDYGYLYDALDADMKRNVDSLVDISRRATTQMPPDERKFWDSLSGASPRDAFIAMMRRDTLMTAALRGQYTVLDVDTMVVMTIQRGTRPAELWYFQAEGGKLRVSDPPRPPEVAMPSNHPPVEQAPPVAPEGSGATPDSGKPR